MTPKTKGRAGLKEAKKPAKPAPKKGAKNGGKK